MTIEARGATFFLQLHWLRWPSLGGGPLGSVLTIGPLTVGFCPFVVTERLRKLVGALKKIGG